MGIGKRGISDEGISKVHILVYVPGATGGIILWFMVNVRFRCLTRRFLTRLYQYLFSKILTMVLWSRGKTSDAVG